jgi:hypothetical protein
VILPSVKAADPGVLFGALFGARKATHKTRAGVVALCLAGVWGWALALALVCLLSKTPAVVRGQ